jgi:hypothetical protein
VTPSMLHSTLSRYVFSSAVMSKIKGTEVRETWESKCFLG